MPRGSTSATSWTCHRRWARTERQSGGSRPGARPHATRRATRASAHCPRPAGPDTRNGSDHAHHLLSAATLSVAALTLSQLAPASADSIGKPDPQDLHHGVDLRSVVVEHTAPMSWSPRTHTDLQAPSGAAQQARSSSTPTRATLARSTSSPAATSWVPTTFPAHRRLRHQGLGRARGGLLPDAGRLRHRAGADADLPRDNRLPGAGPGGRPRRRHPARGKDTRRDWLGAPRSFTDWVARCAPRRYFDDADLLRPPAALRDLGGPLPGLLDRRRPR